MKEFFKKIIQSDSRESSKRVMAMWTMVLVSIVVASSLYAFIFKDKGDLVVLLGSLLTFILTLSGIGAYQAVKTKTKVKEKEKTDLDNHEDKRFI